MGQVLQLLKMALQATPTSAFQHHQIGLCYKTQMVQIKKSANLQPKGQDRENVDSLVQLALCEFEFEKTLKLTPTFEMAYVELADVYAETGHHREAEDTFQKVLSMEVIEDRLKQAIYFHYG